MYYILSLKHSNAKDKFLTLWRDRNSGYCYSIDQAGVYPEYKEGYHTPPDSLPIPTSDAAAVMREETGYFDTIKLVIPNTRPVL